jgi:hypothetical protein
MAREAKENARGLVYFASWCTVVAVEWTKDKVVRLNL